MSFYENLLSSRLPDQNFGLGLQAADDIMVPTYSFYNNNYFRPWKFCMQNQIQDFGSSISNEKDYFKICLDVQHFQPNEIMVKTTKTEIIIEGKHEERVDEHGCISRQFKRKYKLPENCDCDTVTSSLTKDGVLIIMATKKCLKDDKERIIPIKMCEVCPNFPKTFNENNKIEMPQQTERNGDILKEKKYDQSISKSKNISDDHSSLLSSVKALKISGQENSDKISNENKMESAKELLQMSGEIFDKGNMSMEASSFTNETFESLKSKEATFSSSTSYEMKSSSEKTSEYLNEIIAKEVK